MRRLPVEVWPGNGPRQLAAIGFRGDGFNREPTIASRENLPCAYLLIGLILSAPLGFVNPRLVRHHEFFLVMHHRCIHQGCGTVAFCCAMALDETGDVVSGADACP
jgi:hypothetical protein